MAKTTNSLIGINAKKIAEIQGVIKEYIKSVDEVLKQMEAVKETNAFKGEYKEAVKNYIKAVRQSCFNVVSQLLGFNDKLDLVSTAFKTRSTSLAAGIETAAKTLLGKETGEEQKTNGATSPSQAGSQISNKGRTESETSKKANSNTSSKEEQTTTDNSKKTSTPSTQDTTPKKVETTTNSSESQSKKEESETKKQNPLKQIFSPSKTSGKIDLTNYPTGSSDSDKLERSVLVANYLAQNGNFTKEQAAAMVGVYLDENGCDPGDVMKDEKRRSSSSYGAGIASWTDRNYKNQCLKDAGLPVDTPIENLTLQQQCDMIIAMSQKSNRRYYDALRRCDTLEDASATAVVITGGVGFSNNWSTHPTQAEAKKLSNWYGARNDRKYGESSYHWNLDQRRLENAKKILANMD